MARCRFFFVFFSPLSSGVVLMDNDKNVFVSVPAGSGEMGIGEALVCETELWDMSSHATNSPSPATLMSISASNLSVLACRDATSSEHQSSSLHPRLVFFFPTPLDYRCQPQARTAIGTNEPRDILAFSFLRPPQRISP